MNAWARVFRSAMVLKYFVPSGMARNLAWNPSPSNSDVKYRPIWNMGPRPGSELTHIVRSVPFTCALLRSRLAVVGSGAVHVPALLGSTVYGQNGRYPSKFGGRI